MPDPPSKGFLKGLFGGGPKPLDREELFGETAGKLAASTATHTPGPRMARASAAAVSSASEVSKAHMKLTERGDKLNELEDRTEAMHDEAKIYATNAKTLLNRTMQKKWYQL